jgi:hypothetical protein
VKDLRALVQATPATTEEKIVDALARGRSVQVEHDASGSVLTLSPRAGLILVHDDSAALAAARAKRARKAKARAAR